MKAIRVPIDWHPHLPIFASEPFLSSVSDEYGWIGGVDDHGEIRCILPYTIIRKAILRMVRFRVETIPISGELDSEQEKNFINSSIELLRSLSVDMIIPASTNTLFRSYPDGAIAAPYGSYIVDLNQNEEALWSSVSASHRRKIRLAMKAGVKIRSGLEYAETAYRLVRETFARSSLPFMKHEEFRRFVSGVGDFIRILIAEHQGVLQGCAIFPFSAYRAYYVYGGSIPETQTGAMHLLHWEAIRLFKGMGVRHYDFAGARIDPEKGSKQEGINTFKERFGGCLHKGYLWKFSFHPVKFFVYSLAARFRSGGDIVDKERHKLNYRSL
jgi:lipid II:glycine glycyltransferase (peptidoglycan interpeptide bridge formation enzyme)